MGDKRKKWTYEEVKLMFEQRGYELLEKEYKNYSTKMRFKCHRHSDKELYITFHSFKAGCGCIYCGKNHSTLEEVKEEFRSKGYTLLENEYIKANVKMRYICPHHPDKENKITLSKLREGVRCPYCAKESMIKKKITPFEKVKEEFIQRGYVLLETEYKSGKQSLRYQCPEHPNKETKITLHQLRRGNGCKYCAMDEQVERNTIKRNIDDIAKEFEERGLELLEKTYVNMNKKLAFRCPEHPDAKLSIRYSNFSVLGQGCPLCKAERRKGKYSPGWKGGVSNLNFYLRGLLGDWKQKSLVEHNYRCVITNSRKDLEVHHAKTFKHIRDEVLKKLNLDVKCVINDYSDKELDAICDLFIETHDKILGFPLQKEVHKLFHKIYGYDTTIEELYDFKARYLAGEFDDKEETDTQIELLL